MKRLRVDDGHDHDKQPDSSRQIAAKSFLEQLKAAFEEQNQDFGVFQNVMRDFKENKIGFVEVIARVKELVKGSHDLIHGFNALLPETYKIKVGFDEEQTKEHVVQFQDAIAFLNKVQKRFLYKKEVYEAFLDLLNSHKKGYNTADFKHRIVYLFHGHADLLEELDMFVSDSKSFQPCNEQRASAIPHLYVGDCDVGKDCLDLNGDKGIIEVHNKKRKRANKVNMEWTNWDEEDDINGKSPRKVDYKNSVNEVYNQGLRFCEKVKELNSSDDYITLLKCLHGYSTGKVEKTDLLNMVSDLLGDSDLMDKFEVYLKHCEDIGRFLTPSVREKLLGSCGYLSRSGNVEDKDEEQKYEMERAKEKGRYKEKYMTKSIQELDLSKCKRGTQSYRLLPEDYRIASAGQRSKFGSQVLNDRWLCVGSSSEGYSSKHKLTNQYEEMLNRWEDDKFELDMLVESVRSARKIADKLWKKIKETGTTLESPIHIEDHFSILNLRCIERLYGEHGLDVLDELHNNLKVALPVILARLEQKEEEFKDCRSEFDETWAQLIAENHHKLLDKKQNSRSLNVEPLEAENKETKEPMQKEDELLDTAGGMPFDKKQNSRILNVEPLEAENKETKEPMQKEDELLDTAGGMPFDKKQDSRILNVEPLEAENKETKEPMQKEDELLDTAGGMPFDKKQNSRILNVEPLEAENKETKEPMQKEDELLDTAGGMPFDKKQNSRILNVEPLEAENKETKEPTQKEDELLDTAGGMPFAKGSGFFSAKIHTHIIPLSMR